MTRIEWLEDGDWIACYTTSRAVVRTWKAQGFLVLWQRSTKRWLTCIEGKPTFALPNCVTFT